MIKIYFKINKRVVCAGVLLLTSEMVLIRKVTDTLHQHSPAFAHFQIDTFCDSSNFRIHGLFNFDPRPLWLIAGTPSSLWPEVEYRLLEALPTLAFCGYSFKHIKWAAVATATDLCKSVRNRCVIEVFGGFLVLSLYFFNVLLVFHITKSYLFVFLLWSVLFIIYICFVLFRFFLTHKSINAPLPRLFTKYHWWRSITPNMYMVNCADYSGPDYEIVYQT